MNTIIERITEAIKEILIGMIQNGLEGMFVEVNDKVGTIASQVGQTPQGWNAGVFNLIQNLSQTVIVPIAGAVEHAAEHRRAALESEFSEKCRGMGPGGTLATRVQMTTLTATK